MTITITLEESDRQLVILALAALSIESPGFDMALNTIALLLDNAQEGRAVQYDAFRAVHETRVPDAQKTVIARYGPNGRDYTSGVLLAQHDPILAEALTRARAAGQLA